MISKGNVVVNNENNDDDDDDDDADDGGKAMNGVRTKAEWLNADTHTLFCTAAAGDHHHDHYNHHDLKGHDNHYNDHEHDDKILEELFRNIGSMWY